MVKSGRHTAGDGSFGRSAGAVFARGAALLCIAVALGFLLLHSAKSGDPFNTASAKTADTTTTTTKPPTNSTAPTTTQVPLKAPSQVKVLPLNGSSVAGVAGKAHDRLQAAGYNTLQATDTAKKPATTAVYYTAGYQRE